MAALRAFRKLEKRLVGRSAPKTTADISRRMARVRQAGTKPELLIRRYLTQFGIRYRTKNRDLPGSPDLANRSKQWAIFVHGCYWHRHAECSKATTPKTNQAFWTAKFAANVKRDARAQESLKAMGYRVITVWECQSQDARVLTDVVSQVTPDTIARMKHGND